jgi:hypothetical protein
MGAASASRHWLEIGELLCVADRRGAFDPS